MSRRNQNRPQDARGGALPAPEHSSAPVWVPRPIPAPDGARVIDSAPEVESEPVSAPVAPFVPTVVYEEPAVADPPPPAPERVRFRALVLIFAGATYQIGDEIPERVAMDGFTEGVEYETWLS